MATIKIMYGIYDENKKVWIKKPFADFIYDDGRFIINNKVGIINIKTGKIIKKPFADAIYPDGTFRINGKYGLINMKTGKIIKKVR